jgi:hypothetical protein
MGEGFERGGTLSIGNKVRERNTRRNWVKESGDIYDKELGKELDKHKRK